MKTKNELYEAENKLYTAEDDMNKKQNILMNQKKIREKFNYQNTIVTELESKLNEKNKNIKYI